MMPTIELPYRSDSAELFEPLADRPWAFFLDSARPHITQGRFDVLVADPLSTLVTRGAVTEIRHGDSIERSEEDPLSILRRTLARYAPDSPSPGALPFAGGAVGYFSYDLGRRFERLPTIAETADHLPEMAVGIYDWAVVVDHVEKQSRLVGPGAGSAYARYDFSNAPSRSTPRMRNPLRAVDRLQVSLDRADYGLAFQRVMDYIGAGDCYQVNIARRFSAAVGGDAWAGYLALRAANPAPFSAYLNIPDAQILSASPERFLHVRAGRVETRPIKGTRARHPDAQTDRRVAQDLLASTKDRAENVMIVDLLRNDLGKVCEFGSVGAETICALESFATVHHLVSTVSGTIQSDKHALDVLRACFPGGSITGAPKIRAMQVIEELEGERRGVYCGAIGYVGFDGAMDVNIAIRTLVHRQGMARFWAGGGIVADSTVDAEYQETIDKAAAMISLLYEDADVHIRTNRL